MQYSGIYRRSTALFIETTKGDPVFFLDTERNEALVLSRKLLLAVESNDELALRQMANSNLDDLQDAESVIFDDAGRYRRMPDVSAQRLETWRAAFLEEISRTVPRLLPKAIPLSTFESMARFENYLADIPKLRNEWLEFKAEKYTGELIRWASELGALGSVSSDDLQMA